MQLTKDKINDAMVQYSKQLDYNPEAATHFGIGANWAMQQNQPRPIAELDSEYRGRLWLFNKNGSEVLVMIDNKRDYEWRISGASHFFIPPTLK